MTPGSEVLLEKEDRAVLSPFLYDVWAGRRPSLFDPTRARISHAFSLVLGSAMRLVLAVLVLMSWARRGGVATNVVAHRKKQRKADHDVIIEASMDQRKEERWTTIASSSDSGRFGKISALLKAGVAPVPLRLGSCRQGRQQR